MRLIDADELRQGLGMADDCRACSHYKRSCHGCSNELVTDDFCYAIDHAPTIEPERRTGRWTKAYDGNDGHVKCAGCFKTYDWLSQAQYYNYCPNCGAYMKGKQDGDMSD